jgi:SAM-dependent methyltransferase
MNIQEINKFLEPLRRQPNMPDVESLLQLIKQNDYKFDKDEVLEIYTRTLPRWDRLFFTPNKIAELISVIAQIYNPKSVIDICCGTGNIINCFQDMEVVKGIDINANIIRLAKYINPAIDFIEADTISYDFGNEKYDLVIGNPCFDSWINGRNLGVEIIKKGLNLLNNNGVGIVILEESVLASDRASYLEFRQNLLSHFSLDMVISLPIGIFPYMGVKTSILVIRNGENNQDIFMPEFKDNSLEIADNFKQHKGDFYLPVSKIKNRLDRNHYALQDSIDKILSGHELVNLSDVAEIIKGRQLGISERRLDRGSFKQNGNYLIFNKKDRDGNNFIDNIPNNQCILKSGDIVISRRVLSKEIFISVYNDTGKQTVISELYAIIRPIKHKEYLQSYLQTKDFRILIQPYIQILHTQPCLNVEDLRNIKIPLLSKKELNQLVSKSIELSNKTRFYLLQSSESLKNKDFDTARIYIEQAFENANSEENEHKNVYLKNIDRAEELESALEKEKALHKQLHEKEKEMLSFFTHTMINALSSAPESLRQAIRLLGSEDYKKNTKNYEAINEITALFSTLSLIDCLVETFKQSIYDPEEFKRAWQNDNTGEATPQWFIAAALRQSLNRIIFDSNTRNLIKLLQNDIKLIQPTRKAFLEQVLPLDINKQGVESFYQWLNSLAAIDISIEENTVQFGVNQIKFSLLFSITSELILNALKYWSGTEKIQIRWYAEQDYYIFTVKNACRKNASSNLAGTHKGLAFIKRLMELLGEQAYFTPIAEDLSFTAELKLHKTLLENDS